MKTRFTVFLFCTLSAVFSSGLNAVSVLTPDPELFSLSAGTDSLRGFRIGEVTVTSQDPTTGQPAASPLQVLDRSKIQGLSAQMVGDAVKYFSGVIIKDFGGLGGMKTLSVRSMGAQHTAVSYDGIVLTDCQTGQTDLGRFSVENVESISLNIGDGNSIFQPARVFASSDVLTIRTRRPEFQDRKRFNGGIGLKYGSYGQQEFQGFGAYKLSERWSVNLSALSQHSKGNYDYRLYFGDGKSDFNLVPRTNNEVRNLRLESSLMGRFGKDHLLEVKTYWYDSDRGLPGAVILYNPSSSQHLWDRTAFAQAHYEKPLGAKANVQFNAKLNQTSQHYLNPDYLGASGAEDYRYRQEEAYFSGAILYKPAQGLSLAMATDAAVAGMDCNLKDFSEPTRYSVLTNISAKYVQESLLVTAGLLGTHIRETTTTGPSAKTIARLSPSLNLSLQPLRSVDFFRLRAFWKSSFREPSFNDLYYSAIGNTALKPENSRQANLGMTLALPWRSRKLDFHLAADVFSNRITDKIQALPTRNMFIWSMVNLGKVDIKGLDLNLEALGKLTKTSSWSAAWTHSYQRALDVTDPTSKTYNQQIAYAPRIYGSGRFQITVSEWKMGYSLLYSGHRYVTGQNIAQNDLPAYLDQSLTTEYAIPRTFGQVVIRGELQNLADVNYELVRNFPMPGRLFRLSVRFDF